MLNAKLALHLCIKSLKCILLNISGQILLFIASKVFFRIAAFLFKKCEYKQSNPLFANCSNFNTNLNTIYLFISLCAFGIIVENVVCILLYYTVQ